MIAASPSPTGALTCGEVRSAVWTPAELAAAAAEAVPLGPDGVGTCGRIDLAFAPVDGTTRLVRGFATAPFVVPRVLSVDPAWPAMAVTYLVMVTGGIVQGDRLAIRMELRPGAAVHLTTQAATRIYRAERNCSIQTIELAVHDDAYLEYWPDPLIPFAGARFAQRTLLRVGRRSTIVAREVLIGGRIARGECWQFRFYLAETRGESLDGQLLFRDALRLAPCDAPLARVGTFADFTVLGTAYLIGLHRHWDEVVEVLDPMLRGAADVLAGVTVLPSGAGVLVRILGRQTAPVLAVLERVRAQMRQSCELPAAVPLRK
ncbi:MAG: urease accessory protein UreD [Chloroflexi bacterium]|nr:urease accessory protein UreD [Chloroflexota bacterium]